MYGQLHYDSNPPFQWWVAPDVGLAECQRICEEDLADWGCRYVSYVTGPADPHCFVHQECDDASSDNSDYAMSYELVYDGPNDFVNTIKAPGPAMDLTDISFGDTATWEQCKAACSENTDCKQVLIGGPFQAPSEWWSKFNNGNSGRCGGPTPPNPGAGYYMPDVSYDHYGEPIIG